MTVQLAEAESTGAPPGMVTLKRQAGPPLRFKGQRRLLISDQLADGSDLRIELWDRTSGGYVLAAARPSGTEIVEDATKVADSEAAMSQIESWLPVAARKKRVAVKRVASPEAAIAYFDIQLQAQAEDAFRRLAGEAMANWFR
ncbi:MAG: hypothetical protein AAFV27_09465 [Pseudomonadota bacterium]